MSQPSFGNAGSAWLHSTGVVIHRMIVQQNQAATVIFEISSVWRCTSSCCYERYNSLCPDNSVIYSLPLEKCCVIGILKKKKAEVACCWEPLFRTGMAWKIGPINGGWYSETGSASVCQSDEGNIILKAGTSRSAESSPLAKLSLRSRLSREERVLRGKYNWK